MNRFFAALLLAAPLPLFSQAPTPPAGDAPPEFKLTEGQVSQIIKQLDSIQTTIAKSRGDVLGKAKTDFSAAAGSDKDARDLYIACYKANHFELKDSAAADFIDWKTKNEAKFKDPDFLAGVRFQLQYLVISLQALDASDPATIMAPLQTFMAQELNAAKTTTKHNAAGAVQVVTTGPKMGKQPVVGRNGQPRGNGGGGGNGKFAGNEFVQILLASVRNSEFARAYHIEDYFRKEDWSYEPLDFGGIYANAIFPYYRDKKPKELAAQWETRINLEFNLQEALLSESEYQLYWTEKMPIRLWDKANDLFTNRINPTQAVADMLKVVRDNPKHPRAVEWTKHLRELVNQSQPSVPPSVPTPPPVATPTVGDAPATTADATK